VSTVFPWAVICATYLRFRRVVKVQFMRSAIPPEALSPLQPYLATYGLIMTALISSYPFPEIGTNSCTVIFEGFEVFAITSDFWKHTTDNRLYDMAPYIMIAVLCILLSGWLVYYRWKDGVWDLKIPRLQQVNIRAGMAPRKPDAPIPDKWWKRWGEWILGNI
jgi:amino acid permease